MRDSGASGTPGCVGEGGRGRSAGSAGGSDGGRGTETSGGDAAAGTVGLVAWRGGSGMEPETLEMGRTGHLSCACLGSQDVRGGDEALSTLGLRPSEGYSRHLFLRLCGTSGMSWEAEAVIHGSLK